LLRSSGELDVFLRDYTEAEFRHIKNQKPKPPVDLKDHVSINGHLELDWSRENEETKEMENYLGFVEVLRRRLKS
jgi:hypothetical protein